MRDQRFFQQKAVYIGAQRKANHQIDPEQEQKAVCPAQDQRRGKDIYHADQQRSGQLLHGQRKGSEKLGLALPAGDKQREQPASGAEQEKGCGS